MDDSGWTLVSDDVWGAFAYDPSMNAAYDLYSEDSAGVVDQYYRSESPPPLPIPPRIYHDEGHTRTPTLPRTQKSSALRSSADVLRSSADILRTYIPPTHSPLSVDPDTITWAAWDFVSHRRVLIIGYSTGVQVWDCSELGSVTEILNLTLSSEDWTVANVRFNTFVRAAVVPSSQRPLFGILLSSDNSSGFFIYSLNTHQIIHRILLPGIASTFVSNHHFIIITTSILHIFSTSTFETLWTSSHTSTPVFAFSGRLLAYASPSPTVPHAHSRPTSVSSAASVSPLSSLPFGLTQNDLGNAALRVGGTMLNGIKLAYEAAKHKASPISPPFVSRSAPADERPFVPEEDKDKVVVMPHTNTVKQESGFYVTVLDLRLLLHGANKPLKVAEFITSRSQPIAHLAFSKDGCKLVCVPENGQVTRVFSLRPRPVEEVEDRRVKAGDGIRWYNLRRGRTSVIVEALDCSKDGRWVAIGTRNRTIHVFPINPFGGRPDIGGHLHGRVRNVDEFLQHDLIEVSPLVRLRPLPNSKPEHESRAPLAFAFLNPGDVDIPTGLSPRSRSAQDILVFDPADGLLSLRRIITDQRPKDQLGLASVPGVVSRSLPGTVGSPVRISGSPGSVSRASSTSTNTEVIMELVGGGEVMATWNLQRNADWNELRKSVEVSHGSETKSRGADWLAQAELSTCSRSPRILPRSIYLSHQFTFWTFCEDYHALLRQYHFNVRGSKIHVRRQVQVSIGVGLNNTSDRFIEDQLDFNHPSHAHLAGLSTSFDEPLASALSGDLMNVDYVPTILPMYPNGGISGSGALSKTPAFIRNSIPIRRIGDGMSEGLGRIRREISSSYQRNKLRSPSLGPRGGGVGDDGGSVPLEFDEEDEDFLSLSRSDPQHLDAVGATAATGVSAESGTTGTSESDTIDVAPPTPESEKGDSGLWKGWESREVGQMVEEIERFDDISVVGFLDEEHEREKEVRERTRQADAGGPKKRKKKMSKGI